MIRVNDIEINQHLDKIYEPDDLISICITRNGCNYFWGVPYRIFKSSKFQEIESSLSDEELEALGCILQDIVVFDKYSIDFKQKTGVRKLSVSIRSSESTDKSLLNKLTADLRKDYKLIDNDIMVGTSRDDQ